MLFFQAITDIRRHFKFSGNDPVKIEMNGIRMNTCNVEFIAQLRSDAAPILSTWNRINCVIGHFHFLAGKFIHVENQWRKSHAQFVAQQGKSIGSNIKCEMIWGIVGQNFILWQVGVFNRERQLDCIFLFKGI